MALFKAWEKNKDHFIIKDDDPVAIDRIVASDWQNIEYQKMKELMMQQAGIIGAAAAQAAPVHTSPEELRKAINMRMRTPMAFDHFHPVWNKAKNEVVVFIIHNGEALYIEDGYDMFPSDTFITKLRLMLG